MTSAAPSEQHAAGAMHKRNRTGHDFDFRGDADTHTPRNQWDLGFVTLMGNAEYFQADLGSELGRLLEKLGFQVSPKAEVAIPSDSNEQESDLYTCKQNGRRVMEVTCQCTGRQDQRWFFINASRKMLAQATLDRLISTLEQELGCRVAILDHQRSLWDVAAHRERSIVVSTASSLDAEALGALSSSGDWLDQRVTLPVDVPKTLVELREGETTVAQAFLAFNSDLAAGPFLEQFEAVPSSWNESHALERALLEFVRGFLRSSQFPEDTLLSVAVDSREEHEMMVKYEFEACPGEPGVMRRMLEHHANDDAHIEAALAKAKEEEEPREVGWERAWNFIRDLSFAC